MSKSIVLPIIWKLESQKVSLNLGHLGSSAVARIPLFIHANDPPSASALTLWNEIPIL